MRTHHISRLARSARLAGIIVLAGCMEQATTRAPGTPEPTMDASLSLSNPSPEPGTTVDVYAQVGTATPGLIGSFTARIRYDSTALRYQEEIPIADGTMRATNAVSGLVRFAGAATTGVPAGRLAGYRFLVLRTGAVRTMQLVVDEIHTVTRSDGASLLRAVPNRVELSP